MNFSAGIMRKSVMNKLCEKRMPHELKKLRLMGGLFVLSDEMGSVYMDVDVSDEMNVTTTHKSFAKPMKIYPDENNDNAD